MKDEMEIGRAFKHLGNVPTFAKSTYFNRLVNKRIMMETLRIEMLTLDFFDERTRWL